MAANKGGLWPTGCLSGGFPPETIGDSKTEFSRILCTSKSEAAVTSNVKLCCRYVEANYWQIRSIARPLCYSRASRLFMFQSNCPSLGACGRKWRLTDTDLCPCGKTQTMSDIVESCLLTKLNGGLSRLHSADEDAVSWLTNYGKWHAYEKKKIVNDLEWLSEILNDTKHWTTCLRQLSFLFPLGHVLTAKIKS